MNKHRDELLNERVILTNEKVKKMGREISKNNKLK
jgi:hypothetical protein